MPSASSPSPLLLQVADGGEPVVRACIDRFGPLVWSLARKYTPSATDAEDAVQEIFLDLWRSASRFDPARSTELAFVAMITRRRLLDLRRRRARRNEVSGSPADVRADVEAIVDASSASRTEAFVVAAALAKLEPRERDVLVLATYDGLSQSEIAGRTGVPLGTVKTIARRALLRMRTLLGGPPTASALASVEQEEVES